MSRTLGTMRRCNNGWRTYAVNYTSEDSAYSKLEFEIGELGNLDIPYQMNKKWVLTEPSKLRRFLSGVAPSNAILNHWKGIVRQENKAGYMTYMDWFILKRCEYAKLIKENRFDDMILDNSLFREGYIFYILELSRLELHKQSGYSRTQELYAVWLTTKKNALELYGHEGYLLYNYRLPGNYVVLSDLGIDGVLFLFEGKILNLCE